MSSNNFERLEDYIWDRLDEDAFLRTVVADERLDGDKMLSRVLTIQRDLNTRLRQGVEENYPRLLEQVTAIEQLGSAHSHFQHEMDAVAKRADSLAIHMAEQIQRVRTDESAISNLTKLSRLHSDALRCDELVALWREEKDLIRRTELIAELNAIVKGNDKLKHLKWLHDRCLFNLAEITSRTRQDLVDQLRAGLRSLNAGTVGATVKALQQLLDVSSSHGSQKELNALMDEAVLELDVLFLQLSTKSTLEKAAKLLPQLGTKLHSQLEQFQLLGLDNAQQFARHIGKVITSRVPSNSPYAMKLVQTIYKCVQTHTDSIATVIRDSLNPLKASILSQSIANLFSLIDETFEQDERRDTIVVEKLNAAFRTELASVSWDLALQREMEGNIAKALKYVAVKLEQQLSFSDDALRFIGRVSRTQTHNYQLLNIAHELQFRCWPGLCSHLNAVIQQAVQTILDRMRTTMSLVFASMHDENMLVPLAPGASSSEYVKELCGHLKVFRQHCVLVKPLADSVDALPSFINFCIEQFLLHISLIRPIKAESVDRFVRDLEYLCKNGLEAFDCRYSKLLNSYRQLQQMLDQFTSLQHLSELTTNQQICKGGSSVVPQWFVVQLLICASDSELHLPHDSAGWSISEYVQWFNSHNEMDRWRFLRSLLDAYKQSVVARGRTQFVHNFPLLNQLVDEAIQNINIASA